MAGQGAWQQVLCEQNQSHETRKSLFIEAERLLGRPVVSYFTSFRYAVSIEDSDADMLQTVLQEMDLSKGLALIISSPGGSALAAERIITICRSYSITGGYWAIVPGKAKSAATMVCFGSDKIFMSPTSELGPVDPQIVTIEDDKPKWFSSYNLVKSYESLFNRATRAKGNLEPYLQQLQNYDEREIQEYKTGIELSKDISIRALSSGMMKEPSYNDIEKRIEIFLNPERRTKTHGRPIYHADASSCGLDIELFDMNTEAWKVVYELYIRTNNFVSTASSKCVESAEHSYCQRRA